MTRAFRRETLVAVDAVERALDLARRRVGADAITSKGGRDLVTATDVAVEDAIRAMVSNSVGFPVVGEERGARRRPTARRTGSSIPSAGRATSPPAIRCTA